MSPCAHRGSVGSPVVSICSKSMSVASVRYPWLFGGVVHPVMPKAVPLTGVTHSGR